MHHMKEILFTGNCVIKAGPGALACVHVHTHTQQLQTQTALNIYKRKLQRRAAWAPRLCVVWTHRAAHTCPPPPTNLGPEFPLHAVMRVLGVCQRHRSGSTRSNGCLFHNRRSGVNGAQLEHSHRREVSVATDESLFVFAVLLQADLRSDLQRLPTCVAPIIQVSGPTHSWGYFTLKNVTDCDFGSVNGAHVAWFHSCSFTHEPLRL